jgi:outer membrane protein assembly factor BamB
MRPRLSLSRRDWIKASAATALVGHEAHLADDVAGQTATNAGNVAWIECVLGPVPGRESVRVHLMIVGDRVERGIVEPLGMLAADVSQLRIEGNRITGPLTIGHEPFRNNHSIPRIASRVPVRLELTINGDQVRGTFEGRWPSRATAAETSAVRGEVTGRRRDAERLRRENALADGAVWPSYVGPNQNFSSGPARGELLGDFNQARIVWTSQYIGPTESGSKRYGACVGASGCAGGASPVVAGGRVYQFRYQPSGEAYQQHLDEQLASDRAPMIRQQMTAVGWTEADLRRRWAIDADEELVCIDAATGQTLWTTPWRGEGLNLLDHKCSLTNHTGAFHDGKMHVFGALGIVRAVDVANGRTVWATDVPDYSARMRRLKADSLRMRRIDAPTRSFCHGLNVAGNTIVAPDGIGACGLVGLDAATGRVLWRVPGVLGAEAMPLTWNHDGRAYVIAANAQGQIVCIDAADGAIRWRYREAGANNWTPLLVGDRLVAHKLLGEARTAVNNVDDPGAPFSAPGSNYGQIACWRLTPAGLEAAWQAPAEWGAPWDCPIGSAVGNAICFRGRYSYHVVDVATGARIARHHLPTAVRWDEGHMLAVPGMFVLHPDSQHGVTKMFTVSAGATGRVSPLWSPPHPHATTYQVAMSHAWVDGRLFIRGVDALYCYDLRRPNG